MFEYDETPLHRAAAYNHDPESIKFLIAQGLDVNAQGSTGNRIYGNPLSCAVRYKNLEAIKELLNAGADPNSISSEGINSFGTPFHVIAAEYKNNSSLAKNAIDALIQAGGNINYHYTITNEDLSSLRGEDEFAKYHSIFIPRSKWTSDYPFDNVIDVSNVAKDNLLATLTPLMSAVLNDNPDVVDILLDSKADANVVNFDSRSALDYANEFFTSSKLKNSPVFEKLKAATTEKSDTKKDSAFDMADSLVAQGKIPMYVRDKGKFIYNPEISTIKITGKNVNLRSQPNTKSNILAQYKGYGYDEWPRYLGEWIHPNGERWVVGEYEIPDSDADPMTVWIFGKYTELLTAKEIENFFAEQERIAQENARREERRGEELIDFVRNRMYYKSFSKELGYGPVGKQCEKFFANGSWSVGTSGSKIFEKQCAVFKGIAQNVQTKRRYMFTIFFNVVAEDTSRFKKGSVMISQINQNDDVVYLYSRLSKVDAFKADLQMYDLFGNGLLSHNSENANEFTLEEFLEMIYREVGFVDFLDMLVR